MTIRKTDSVKIETEEGVVEAKMVDTLRVGEKRLYVIEADTSREA